MAGLLEKDFRLIVKRKTTLLVFALLALGLGLSQSTFFILGYLPILVAMICIGTISYDDYDGGLTFLMTLPINTGIYVREKYVFCVGGTILSWIAAIGICLMNMLIRGETAGRGEEGGLVIGILSALLAEVLLVAIMIPLQLKFGAEKSRIVLFVIFGVVMAGSYFLSTVTGTGIDNSLIIQKSNGNFFLTGIIILIILIFGVAASYGISRRIMRKKEF